MKSRTASDPLLLLLLAGLGALWFFGRTQPIEVTERIAVDQRAGACSVCGGAGSLDVPVTCTTCGGSGKGEWKLKPTPANQRVDTRPTCVVCRGSGKVTGREPCTACDGTGRAAAGQKRAVATTRAGLSLWERILKFFHIAPDANPAPQMNKRGGYDLVERYMALQPGGTTARLSGYGTWHLAGGDWLNTAFVEYGSGGRPQQVEFVVRDREVVALRRLR